MSSRPAKAAASTMCSCEPLSSEDTVDLGHRLLGMTTSKSEDIMIHAGSDPFPQHCRLRASIPGRLWRWKEISEWTWKHAGDQIDLLELRAILTTISWKIHASTPDTRAQLQSKT